MTGQELHELLLSKWGRSYDIQLRQVKGKVYCQVMWKYLEQASFPLSEQEYYEHLNAIANYLTTWGTIEQVKTYVDMTKERPRLGKVVSIPLDLGERSSEWIINNE
ncbi:DUF3067 family protein [Aphanothece sacrum]|uniref:DUF3067 domain-containing protein n=1 Tax=Aphanothece sacrum FPU1 TaxID=1920663 RepID=A0A401ICP7_APHSA|nr:DUF3067 family protein [Aphanothece sacrum]GBF79068.1 hypothetical protein AsFPU1_0460 [Aphanothece sacrum FPU1]GBF86026.1 hypothetical protein AsFPU3_3096 [Aphanothece sacrum FPU3]